MLNPALGHLNRTDRVLHWHPRNWDVDSRIIFWREWSLPNPTAGHHCGWTMILDWFAGKASPSRTDCPSLAIAARRYQIGGMGMVGSQRAVAAPIRFLPPLQSPSLSWDPSGFLRRTTWLLLMLMARPRRHHPRVASRRRRRRSDFSESLQWHLR